MKTSSYVSFEEAYKELVVPLSHVTSTRLFNPDFAIDAVQDAFTKVVEYLKKNPGKRISKFLLTREAIRACRRLNKKFGYFLPSTLNYETE